MKNLAIFFFVSQMGKFQHWPKHLIIRPKSSQHVQVAFTCGKENSTVLGGALHSACMFEGGNFVKSKSDTCDQYPLKTLQPHKLCDSVAEPSLPTSVRFIYYFVFEETVCNFAFAYYNLHFVCAQEKADLAVPA